MIGSDSLAILLCLAMLVVAVLFVICLVLDVRDFRRHQWQRGKGFEVKLTELPVKPGKDRDA